MPNYEWSDDSAIWQLVHGLASERTESAVTHLEVSINGGDLATVRGIALRLLGLAETEALKR